MIPKGLAVAAGIGAISGVIFGLIFVDFANLEQLVFVEGSSVSIVTEKTDFKKGEPINIRIVNSGTSPIIFSDSSYGLKITQLDGIELYSPPYTEKISTLQPGDEASFIWDQIKNDGDAVLHGTYKIITKGTDENQDEVKRSITINIFK